MYHHNSCRRQTVKELPAQTLTAFVGASGAGKTMAAQLIPQFWEASNGSITIDGKAIKAESSSRAHTPH
ncbi:MAG: ATP-binding cassette domain-containing protein [Coriobacteriales bacterium]|jgi:ABC-type multidrug transport system fused ATPase/permease subunit|nr:ATP-binding cassette domain-containing protein [Coriobacteriales bacterium]